MSIQEEIQRCAELSDQELWCAMPRLAQEERTDLVRFLIYLMEVKRRELHVERAYPGLYTYLVQLGFSEWESRARAIAVGAAEKFRSVLGLLKSGRLTLTSLALIGPHLNSENYRRLLGKACRRSKREVEALIAGLTPRSGRRDVVRVISAPSPVPSQHRPLASTLTSVVSSPENGGSGLFPELDRSTQGEPASRVGHSFDGPEELERRIERAKGLLLHKYPSGSMEFILLDALDALLEKIDPERRFQRRLKRQQRRVQGHVSLPNTRAQAQIAQA